MNHEFVGEKGSKVGMKTRDSLLPHSLISMSLQGMECKFLRVIATTDPPEYIGNDEEKSL
jgi:hypothetical protein